MSNPPSPPDAGKAPARPPKRAGAGKGRAQKPTFRKAPPRGSKRAARNQPPKGAGKSAGKGPVAGEAPRAAALAALSDILEKQIPLDEAVDRAASAPFGREREAGAPLSARDRAYCRALVATTLRRWREIEDGLKPHLSKSGLPRPLRIALSVGAADIAHLGTPGYAAVSALVAAAGRRPGMARYKGVLNAVLRKLAEAPPSPLPLEEAAQRNLPPWMLARWQARFGSSVAARLATAQLTQAPLDLALNPHAPAPAQGPWVESLKALGAQELPLGHLRLEAGGAVTELPGFGEGAWWVQDFAASLPGRLLRFDAGDRVLDLCAAPGGKTAELAARGAKVTAVDLSKRRLKQLEANLQRLGLQAETVAADLLTWRPAKAFEFILLDAPCSATGTLRRHPDIPHLRKESDIRLLAKRQARLLERALSWLAPGGTLVYAVCSLEEEEGPARIEAALAQNKKIARVHLEPAELEGAGDLITEAGDLLTGPHLWAERGGMDGFYACRLTRLEP